MDRQWTDKTKYFVNCCYDSGGEPNLFSTVSDGTVCLITFMLLGSSQPYP